MNEKQLREMLDTLLQAIRNYLDVPTAEGMEELDKIYKTASSASTVTGTSEK